MGGKPMIMGEKPLETGVNKPFQTLSFQLGVLDVLLIKNKSANCIISIL